MVFILASQVMTIVVLQFFMGLLADRLGKKRMMLAGIALGSLTSVGCALAMSWKTLLTFRIAGGVADCMAAMASFGMTAELSQGKTGTFFGILRASSGLSWLFGPILGGWVSLVSFRAPFWADAALSGIAALLVATVVTEVTASPESEAHSLSMFKHLGVVFSDRIVWMAALFGISEIFAYSILSASVPIKVDELGAPPWMLSFVLVGQGTAFSVTSFLCGRAADRFGKKPFFIAAESLLLAACLGLSLSETVLGTGLWYFIFGLGAGTAYTLCFALATGRIGRRFLATSLAAFDTVIDLSFLFGPPLAAAAMKVSGTIGAMFWLALLPALISLPLALGMSHEVSLPYPDGRT
jgi:MFS family permease